MANLRINPAGLLTNGNVGSTSLGIATFRDVKQLIRLANFVSDLFVKSPALAQSIP